MRLAKKRTRGWLFAALLGNILLQCGLLVGVAAAQTADNLAAVKRVALEWPDADKNSAGVRDRVLQKLKASKAVEIVPQAGQADAVLRGKATIWVASRELLSPKSKSVEQVRYTGYASMELSGKDGQTLWSYLATPRPLQWRAITDDLGDQLARKFLEALAGKGAEANLAPAGASGATGSSAGVTLRGAGATFPAPMYLKWFESFAQARPGVQIQYAPVGSQEGAKRFLAGQTDFGASDRPLSDQELNAPNGRVLQIATLVGAVVPIFNVNGATEGLNVTPEVLAGILMGKIRRWDAPEIHAINKHVRLPDEAIQVIHRSDGSGTTYALTDYLSKMSPEWQTTLGTGTSVNWPVGEGAEGNEGVATTVRKTPNSIGYVEFLYALQHELSFVAVRSASGEYVKADLDSVTAAAKTAELPKEDRFGVSITNASGKHVYPIATFTWLLVPAQGRDAEKTAALRELLRWILTSGQRQCAGLGYAPLPAEFANRELQALSALH